MPAFSTAWQPASRGSAVGVVPAASATFEAAHSPLSTRVHAQRMGAGQLWIPGDDSTIGRRERAKSGAIGSPRHGVRPSVRRSGDRVWHEATATAAAYGAPAATSRSPHLGTSTQRNVYANIYGATLTVPSLSSVSGALRHYASRVPTTGADSVVDTLALEVSQHQAEQLHLDTLAQQNLWEEHQRQIREEQQEGRNARDKECRERYQRLLREERRNNELEKRLQDELGGLKKHQLSLKDWTEEQETNERLASQEDARIREQERAIARLTRQHGRQRRFSTRYTLREARPERLHRSVAQHNATRAAREEERKQR